jgi:hypothetical protein
MIENQWQKRLAIQLASQLPEEPALSSFAAVAPAIGKPIDAFIRVGRSSARRCKIRAPYL